MAKVSRKKAAARAARRDDLSAAAQAVRRILRALRLAGQEIQRSAGISAAQLFALAALADGRPTSLAELARRTMTDRSSVSGVVDRLVAGKLATRRPSADDRRRAAICITAAGRGALAHAPRSPMALLVDGLAALPAATRASLARGLEALTVAMGLADEPATMLFEDPTTPASRRSPRSAR